MAEEEELSAPPQALAGQAEMVAKKMAGRGFIDFLIWSDIEFFPGALYAAPILTIYMFIGLLKPDPFWHQLKTWEKVLVLGIDILLFVIIVLAIALIGYFCNGVLGGVLKFIAPVTNTFGWTVGQIGTFCKQLPTF